jgi:hypothetical protein
MPDAKQASQRVLNDRLDVLIDMDGYSNEGLRRSELFALRHAPVTVRGSRRGSAKQRNFSNGAKALAARRLLQRLKTPRRLLADRTLSHELNSSARACLIGAARLKAWGGRVTR